MSRSSTLLRWRDRLRQAWDASRTRALVRWYAGAVRGQPLGHAGLIVLMAAVVHLLGQLGRPEFRRAWPYELLVILVGAVALGEQRSWNQVCSESAILRRIAGKRRA